ncbi:SPOR domain-containing protein [Prolixibacteraceae bacterium JC049]|nr:SPOR domain-containing protein [Prolixibacteraceae bacterium JC049]
MNRYLICLIIGVCISGLAYAQEAELVADSLINRTDSVGFWSNGKVKHDARVDSLLALDIRLNRKKKSADGFRLQIFSTSGVGARERAQAIKARFLGKNPEYDVYVKFQSPDWKVRVGNFRNKSEVLKLKSLVKRDFPDAFIVPDQIEFPALLDNTISSYHLNPKKNE